MKSSLAFGYLKGQGEDYIRGVSLAQQSPSRQREKELETRKLIDSIVDMVCSSAKHETEEVHFKVCKVGSPY